MKKIIDCMGMACPLPVVNAKKASEELQAGDVLTVLVDNEIAPVLLSIRDSLFLLKRKAIRNMLL